VPKTRPAFSIRSPDGRLTAAFNAAGFLLRFFETLPNGATIDYLHGPMENRNPMMHPWCNRIEAGEFRFRGHVHKVRPLHGRENNALHGNWLKPWRIIETGPHHVVLEFSAKAVSADQDENGQTPYSYTGRQTITLDNAGMGVRMSVVNDGMTLPFGVGMHPFLARPQDTIVCMRVDAMENCGPDMIPDKAAPIAAVPAEIDLSNGLIISNANLQPPKYGFGNADLMDNCFPGVEPRKGALIRWPSFGDEGRQMRITASDNCQFGVCFVPGPANDLPVGEMSFFCLELATNGVDAWNRMDAGETGTGAIVLAKGETLEATTRYTLSPIDPESKD
jgi:aldose 1-epimerase